MKKSRLDKVGRIVIPKPYCKELNLVTGSQLTITLENGAVVVRPDATTCRICHVVIAKNSQIPLCKDCIAKVCKVAQENE